MSFKDKLADFFKSVSITPPKTSKYIKHRYCDFIELITLFSNDNYISKDNIISRLHGEGVNLLSSEDQEELDSSDGYSDYGSSVTSRNDAEESNIIELFEMLAARSKQFNSYYPFEIKKEYNAVKLKTQLSLSNKLYIALLICSQLNNFSEFQHYLTSEFEKISFEALKAYLPDSAIVKEFGKQSAYRGPIQEKIKNLSDESKIEINEFELSNIPVSSNQDKGLDIVGWIPFSDKIPNMLVFLCQCACGLEYSKKQQDTRNFAEYFNFYKQRPIHSLFVPHSYGNFDLRFDHSDSFAKDVIIFERKRILDLIENQEFFKQMKTYQIVNRCIETQEGTV